MQGKAVSVEERLDGERNITNLWELSSREFGDLFGLCSLERAREMVRGREMAKRGRRLRTRRQRQ